MTKCHTLSSNRQRLNIWTNDAKYGRRSPEKLLRKQKLLETLNPTRRGVEPDPIKINMLKQKQDVLDVLKNNRRLYK